MKNFFKILLKIILWLILWIIIIVAIWLVIINNRTLKFYENDYGDIRFTMDKDFKVEDWTEIILNLGEWTVLYKDIYHNWKIDTIEWSNIKRKNLSSDVIITEDWYIKRNMFFKIKIPKISLIRELYKNWNIYDFSDILWLCYYLEYTDYYDNWQISEKWQLINWLEDWYNVFYYENWNIEKDFSINYINWDLNNLIYTWYYKDWNIKNTKYRDSLNEIWTWYYNNWNIKYISNSNWYNVSYYDNWNIKNEYNLVNYGLNWTYTWYYINWNLFKIWKIDEIWIETYTYYNEDWNILWTWYFEDWKFKWFNVDVHNNWQILFIWDLNWIWTWYYNNWNISFIANYNDWILTWESINYYNNWNILAIRKHNWNWFSYSTYYDDFWNILWTWEQHNGNPVDWFYITISRDWQILEKWKYNTIRKDWYRVEYFDDGQIYSEWNYDNWKRVWVWNRYLWDWSIWVSKDYWWNEKINN